MFWDKITWLRLVVLILCESNLVFCMMCHMCVDENDIICCNVWSKSISLQTRVSVWTIQIMVLHLVIFSKSIVCLSTRDDMPLTEYFIIIISCIPGNCMPLLHTPLVDKPRGL